MSRALKGFFPFQKEERRVVFVTESRYIGRSSDFKITWEKKKQKNGYVTRLICISSEQCGLQHGLDRATLTFDITKERFERKKRLRYVTRLIP